MKHPAFGVFLFCLPVMAAPQNRAQPVPASRAASAPALHIPGAITNTGFAGQLGRSIQGQALRGGRGLPVTPFLIGAPGYAPAPVYYYPVPPVVINQTFVSLPSAPPDEAPPAPTPDPPVFSGYQAPPEQPDNAPDPTAEQAASPAPPPPASGVLRPALYLIAAKGGGVQTAVAYWYEDSSLHYVGRDHEMHAIPLEDVDRGRTAQLNSERGLDFHFPD